MAEPNYKLTIHVDRMTLGDLEVLEDARTGKFREYLDLLDRVATLEGLESVRMIPLADLRAITAHLVDSISDTGNSGN